MHVKNKNKTSKVRERDKKPLTDKEAIELALDLAAIKASMKYEHALPFNVDTKNVEHRARIENRQMQIGG